MTTMMPTDDNNNPIPALRLRSGAGAHSISASATSARNTMAFDSETQIVSVFATVAIFMRFGDSGVTATTSDHYFPAGLYYDIAIGGDGQKHTAHLAVIRAEPSDGVVYISEKT